MIDAVQAGENPRLPKTPECTRDFRILSGSPPPGTLGALSSGISNERRAEHGANDQRQMGKAVATYGWRRGRSVPAQAERVPGPKPAGARGAGSISSVRCVDVPLGTSHLVGSIAEGVERSHPHPL